MTLLDLLFPRRCVSCGKIGSYFCKNCLSKIEYITYQICPICEKPAIDGMTHPRCQTRYSLDGLTSFFRYRGPIRQALKEVKYRFVSDLAEEFVSLIPLFSLQSTLRQSSGQAMEQLSSATMVPIPLHPSRLRFRGFNQAEVLGSLLAKRLNIPLRTNILKRVRKTTPQVEMKDRKKRLKNMEGVFTVNNFQPKTDGPLVQTMKPACAGRQCSNETILLFDDVFTTGATLRSAANILKRAGAKKVWGIVLAHG